jgi:hypothetical protein
MDDQTVRVALERHWAASDASDFKVANETQYFADRLTLDSRVRVLLSGHEGGARRRHDGPLHRRSIACRSAGTSLTADANRMAHHALLEAAHRTFLGAPTGRTCSLRILAG